MNMDPQQQCGNYDEESGYDERDPRQRAPPKHYQGTRPMVNPEAEGEVDPEL